jgi:hypothetical protein
MNKITIAIGEDVVRWGRRGAAERETSLSRLVGELLREKMTEEENYQTARRQYLSQPLKALKNPEGNYPQRYELHEN